MTGPVAMSWPSHQSVHEDAIRAAQAMLQDTPLPSGSIASAHEPVGDGGQLGSPSRIFDTPTLVDLHRFFVVPGSPASVVDSMSQRPPAGSSVESDHATTSGKQVLVFSWPTSGAFFSDQLLLVNAVALSGNRTALRLDAQVVWLPVKPRGDFVHGAKVVDVRRTWPGSTSMQTAVISNPGSIANLLQRFNQMMVAPPGGRSCPNEAGPTIRLDFKHGASAPPFATAIAVGTGCREVRVRQSGAWVSPRLLGYAFVFFVGRVAGIGAR